MKYAASWCPRLIWVTLAFSAAVGRPLAIRAEESSGKPASPADYDGLVTKSDRGHWAFRPIRRPAVPAVKNAGWVRNPIDAFLVAKLEEKGWEPAVEAQPYQLLRRIYLDLIGLPPTPKELADFLADKSPDALDRVTEDLLARPAYGERWGRHWLDLVRYAETNGYERDGTKPHVWRYRDYVVRSFNDDKPYDRFLLEQLAGDELDDASAETVIALGYYRLGPWDDEPADPQEDRYDQLDDIISTTSQVVLGLTLGCARCHNHKFEPLTQLDYYRMAAVFNTLQRFQNGRSDLDAPAGTAEELAAWRRMQSEIADIARQREKLRDEFKKEFLEAGHSRLPDEAQAAFRSPADKRSDQQKQLVEKNAKDFESEVAAALPQGLKVELAGLEREMQQCRARAPQLPMAYFMHEPSPSPPVTHLLMRGKATRPGIEATPGVPVVLTPEQPALLPADARTSRRRLSMARWLTSSDNPLAARVIVNRVWQFHFGEGLVRTPSDFGVMGTGPTHPELLDWLADWFVREGWSLKKLHRLILSSHAYRMSKAWRDDCGRTDPENERLWRFPYRRLEVEAIRDSILSVSGRLNGAMFGPSMHPFVPKEAMAGHSDPDKIWPSYNEAEASRRTVYAFIKRSLVVPMIEVLDLCDTTKSSARRAVTSVAPQALTLFNGQFANEQAAHFANRLERDAGTDPTAQIDRAYLLAFSRAATAAEREAMLAFLSEETEKALSSTPAGDPPPDRAAARHQALVQLCRVIFNLNEMVYAD